MGALAFDSLAYAKTLKEAGFTEQQAEALAESQARLIDERLATKEDLKMLELRLKHDLTLRLGSLMVIGIGVVAMLGKLL